MDLYSDQLKVKAGLIGSMVDKALDWSEMGNLLSVHSVFQRVVNIKTPLGLISIVTKSIGKSASYIVLDQEIDFLSTQIKADDTVRLNQKYLIFNNFVVDMNNAQVWDDIIDSDFKWGKERIGAEKLKIFKSTIDRYAVSKGAWEKLQTNINFNERIKKLTLSNPVEAIKGLIGLGPGLTPTGDDVLLGFLSVVNTCDDFYPVRKAFNDEILANLKYTSDISASFLKMATENHYHEYVQNVLFSMAFGMPENVLISVKKLQKIGATSGTDIATGIYLGFSI